MSEGKIDRKEEGRVVPNLKQHFDTDLWHFTNMTLRLFATGFRY